MKKKVIISLIAVVVLLFIAIGSYYGFAYNTALKNENFSENEIKEIALSQVDGEIVRIQKEFEIEDSQLSLSEFEYTIEIKTPENRLVELKISSRMGTVEID